MTKEYQFWNWFKNNEAQFFFLNQIEDDNERERILDDFLSHLHTYCDHLFFAIGGHPDDKQDLIITAEGDPDFFDKAELLVKEAPLLEYWKVIALKPIMGNGIVEFNDITLTPETMWFIPLRSEKSTKIGLKVFIDNFAPENNENFLAATYLVLDNLLGERSSALDIGHIEIENLPPIHQREDLIELTKLPKYIIWKRNKPII